MSRLHNCLYSGQNRRYQPIGNAGFTLIETVITLAVFIIGIVGVFAFAIANMNAVRSDADRYLAANLAREGIEIVKNVRDSNWLKIDANFDCDTAQSGIQLCGWDQGLTKNYYITDYNDTSKYPPAEMTEVLLEADYWLDNKRLYIDSSGFYSHANTGTATNIFRTIEIKGICLDESSNPPTEYITAVCPANTKIGLQVIAHMRWSRGSQIGRLDMPDSLYNWRK